MPRFARNDRGRDNDSAKRFGTGLASLNGMTQITPTLLTSNAVQKPVETAGETAIGALIDIVNPLQHIPFVSTLYRAVTGDTISAGAKLIGGGIFGGIGGLASSAADMVFEAATGNNVGDTLLETAQGIELPTGTTASAAPAIPMLTPDNGQALMEVNLVRMAGMETSTAAPAFGFALDRTALGLQADASLGLTNAYKQTQMMSQLDEVALDLKG